MAPASKAGDLAVKQVPTHLPHIRGWSSGSRTSLSTTQGTQPPAPEPSPTQRPGGLYRARSRAPPGRPLYTPVRCPCYITIFAKTQGLPLLPLHQDADGAHAHVDEEHAHGGVQEEVDEVPVRRGHRGTVRKHHLGNSHQGARPHVLPGSRSRLGTWACLALLWEGEPPASPCRGGCRGHFQEPRKASTLGQCPAQGKWESNKRLKRPQVFLPNRDWERVTGSSQGSQ